jgi:hypothetical protein
MLTTLFQLLSPTTYQCACCDRQISDAVYQEGAFFCRPCARGEHRHAGWGTKAA